MEKLNEEERKMVPGEQLLGTYINAINQGAYNNIRMLRNDIEESIYYEILKAKGIL